MWCDVVWVPRSFWYALTRSFCYAGLLTRVRQALMRSFCQTQSFWDAQCVVHRSRQCTRCRIVPEVAILKVYKPVRMGGYPLRLLRSLTFVCTIVRVHAERLYSLRWTSWVDFITLSAGRNNIIQLFLLNALFCYLKNLCFNFVAQLQKSSSLLHFARCADWACSVSRLKMSVFCSTSLKLINSTVNCVLAVVSTVWTKAKLFTTVTCNDIISVNC